MHWLEVAPELFVFNDCCNVYALRDGRRALLIDLGSGHALSHLPEIGVESVAAVYFTHAHRDQCQGASAALERGLELHFPKAAAAMVEPGSRPDFRMMSPAHLAYPSRFHPPRPMPGAKFDLQAPCLIDWGPYDLELFPAPGHIDHQVAFRVDGPWGSALFCGDALHSRGKVHEAYCLEHDHYTGAGARIAADTLCALRNLRAQRICPSHGPVTDEAVWDAFTVTAERLRALADLKDTILPRRPAVRRLLRPHAGAFHRVSAHLYLWQNSYFLVSEEGAVLMVDVQCKLPDSFHKLYYETLGERPVEVVLISHLHCDHVMGIEELRGHQPLQCWAHESLVEAVENPYALARPWLHNDPAKVDCVLGEAETVRWREYELTAYWFPGQTDFHAVYATEVDGRTVLFSGDNFYPAQQWGGTGGLCGYNGGHPALWRRSAELVMRLEPEWMLASHMQPFVYRRADFEAVVDWSETVAALMREIAPDGNLERCHSPHFLEVRPYVQPAAPAMPVALRVRNTYPRSLTLRVAARLPEGLAGDTATRTIELAAGEEGSLSWELAAAEGLAGMHLVTFDVSDNDGYRGEAAECYVRGAGWYEGM
ncbi:MAG: MBL fold metallo-hydrolase [Armatimonadetes bacterium]|nr:MBL fold metallo-hydrolase [Armatimonadota bacterium]